jgi:UDP-glucose 4-epimerase
LGRSKAGKILVTGGAGFIGRHLARALVKAGAEEVRILDDFSRSEPGQEIPFVAGTQLIEGDIRNPEHVRIAVEGCDTVFHLAAVATVSVAEQEPARTFDVNVAGTFNVVTAARQAGVRRVIHASSREVYGEVACLPVPEDAPLRPKNVYGQSKAAAEHVAVMNRGSAEVSIVRLANVYGPGDHGRVIPLFLGRAMRGEPLRAFGGEQILDLVYIDDVVEMLRRVAMVPCCSDPINIGSGTGTTVLELARRVIELTKSASKLVIEEARDFEVRGYVADTARSRELLGFRAPKDPLYALPHMIQPHAQKPPLTHAPLQDPAVHLVS